MIWQVSYSSYELGNAIHLHDRSSKDALYALLAPRQELSKQLDTIAQVHGESLPCVRALSDEITECHEMRHATANKTEWSKMVNN